MARIFARLKSIDFFKKLPSDLTEATLTGAWISIAAAVIMVFLFAAVRTSWRQLQRNSGAEAALPATSGCCVVATAMTDVARLPPSWQNSRIHAHVQALLYWSQERDPSPCLHLQELMSFMSVSSTTQLVVDRSPQNELLKVNFNIRCGITGPVCNRLPCLSIPCRFPSVCVAGCSR